MSRFFNEVIHSQIVIQLNSFLMIGYFVIHILNEVHCQIGVRRSSNSSVAQVINLYREQHVFLVSGKTPHMFI